MLVKSFMYPESLAPRANIIIMNAKNPSMLLTTEIDRDSSMLAPDFFRNKVLIAIAPEPLGSTRLVKPVAS